jgi:hypothetical protein
MRLLPILGCSAVLLAMLSCATNLSKAQTPSTESLGSSKATAIEVCMVQGEREYLSRLLCSSGQAAGFKRIGSFGNRTERPSNMSDAEFYKQAAGGFPGMRGAPLKPGEVDYHIIDGYEIACGELRQKIYLDMYHCPGPSQSVAPPGFTLRAP